MDFDPATHIWPITADGIPELKVGDVFTMEVPCDPDTGMFSALKFGAVLMKRTFKVAKGQQRLVVR